MNLLGYSKRKYEVFVLDKEKITEHIEPKVKISTEIIPLKNLTVKQIRELKKEQGIFGVNYLKLKYGSSESYICLGYAEDSLAHVDWLIPAKKIRGRYSFIPENSYAAVSCVTMPRFRSMGIYSAQLQKVVNTGIPANKIWIWAEITNAASLRGIRKAGSIKTGEVVQKRWLWGCFSSVRFYPLSESG